MRRAALGMRRGRSVAVAALVAGLLLGGCGQGPSDPGRVASEGLAAVEVAEPETPASTAPETKPSAPAMKKPRATAPSSLPPGDPGLDAPAVPDPGTDGPDAHGDEPARRTVPVGAMLTADTVSMMLGGRWAAHADGGDECVRPEGALGSRTMSYGGTAAGLVVETVATYENAKAADAAVAALGRSAQGCGWTSVRDPRLGSASLSATEGPRSMVAVSTEGVLVLLVGTGDFTRDAGRWGSLVDLALGTSCPAAPDGCH